MFNKNAPIIDVTLYSSTLMHANLYGDHDLENMYGYGVMSVSMKEFQTYVVHICNDVKDNNWRIHHVWIDLAKYIPLRFIDDPL